MISYQVKNKQKNQPTVKHVKLLLYAIGMLLEPEIRDAPEWGIQSFTVLCAFWIAFKHLEYKLPYFFSRLCSSSG